LIMRPRSKDRHRIEEPHLWIESRDAIDFLAQQRAQWGPRLRLWRVTEHRPNLAPIHAAVRHAESLQTWVLPLARTTGETLPDTSERAPG